MKTTSVGIVITTYNVKDKVLEAIDAICRQVTEVECRVLVVDSGSTDGTNDAVAARFPDVEVIRFEENIGLTKTRNIGFDHFPGLHVICLDSDVIMEPDAVEALIAGIVDDRTGSVCGILFSEDGSRQCTAFRRPTLLNFGARLCYAERLLPAALTEKYSEQELLEPATPFWTSGGFTLYTRAALDAAGGRDEDYFCLRRGPGPRASHPQGRLRNDLHPGRACAALRIVVDAPERVGVPPGFVLGFTAVLEEKPAVGISRCVFHRCPKAVDYSCGDTVFDAP